MNPRREEVYEQLLKKAAKATSLPKFPNERLAPSREDAMVDFNNSLILFAQRQREEK
jgi:hypothetical protein